jgi:aryl-phospho-beta-D-glucosidase BglC (GH1 family)
MAIHRSRLTPVVLAVFALACATARPSDSDDVFSPGPRTGVPASQNPFLHADGARLADGNGNPVLLRGIAFGNLVWDNPASPRVFHHSEADYRMIRGLGMNAVRFYLNDGLFEDDGAPGVLKPSGFAWLDQNVAWAKANGIYLVLNLHVPPGGFQSNGGGDALWRVRENRRRFTALWRAIALRYAGEPTIAGYDLLNEPVAASSPSQWETLARTTVAAIREVDPRHAIFVERLNAVGAGTSVDWTEDQNGEMNFFLVDDTNVVYEFHFYKPFQFTHQRATWVPPLRGLETNYPGPFTDWDGRRKVGDRTYLEKELAPYFAFGARHGVPLFLGEFGVIRHGYEPGRNGVGWTSDVIDLATAHGVSFTYHAYHEWTFGLWANDGALPPGDLNQPLAELFARKLR